ncbi:HlyC/CorC family transporter [Blastococcus sp. MG754426]|uniref:hemolysin family protein n=1 Tax=unclassified Blastococcus TaxID=2619396 RepID=UPI001EF12637|nr:MULTISPECIES: hemolysin family protein [unclassified Blastococcus]MCF6507559.1 HlyC/CorC family transporter [Blastococcus sp. MG754426]MCF6511951.1 HlyC/CorC family transporter [Blastococcus sp. MG754427]MCF6735156.1 HlyC/CorC family transporter [Blastococcus sp. KM273129]
MTAGSITSLVVAICLIPLAGLFGAMEAALQRVSKARVEELRRDGVKRAAGLEEVVAERARHVSLLLLLRILCEMVAAVIVALLFFDLWDSTLQAVLVAAGVMTVVSYVLVGVGPRTLGRQHAYGTALATAGVVRLLGRVLGPVATLLILVGNAITPGRGFRDGPFSSEVELRELVDMAEERGVVESGERNMIHSVFELGDTIAREVMVPRTDVVWIERTKTVRQALALALRSGFSRIPVIGENVDDVVGVVYLKDLVRRSQNAQDRNGPRVEELMRPPTFVPESKPVDELLRDMQAQRIHIAIVVDEYGGFAGLVTIEDILEEIVGEIADEHDAFQRPEIEQLEDGSARVTARLPVQDLAQLFPGVELPEGDDVETVGGLLARELGRVPIEGAAAEVAGLRLVAESTGGRRNRIDTMLVCRLPEPSEDDDEGADEPQASGATRAEQPAGVES